ncbi:MAG: response regulator [Myxococcales bacterium]|nr:response regulator [Myxococcales bacterium]
MLRLAVDGRGTILLVDDEPMALDLLVRTLRKYQTVTAENGELALELLEQRPVDLIISDFKMPGITGVELLRTCQERHPASKRILMTAYSDLPEVVRARADGVVSCVIPKPSRPENVQTVVAECLAQSAHSAPEPAKPAAPGWDMGAELLRWTGERVVKIRGIVIRQPPRDQGELQLQFVLPRGEAFEQFRADALKQWLWPLKPKDGPVGRGHKRHPVVRMLGGLSADQELYAKQVGEGLYVYLALLPWRREDRATAALGILARAPEQAHRDTLFDVHRLALGELTELPLPKVPAGGAEGPVRHALDYDWVVTENYVGPDRRARPTSFLNRFLFVGKRADAAAELRGTPGLFVDRLSPAVAWFAGIYLVLSLLDTLFTYIFVRSQVFAEMNPLLRGLVHDSPGTFLFVKNALSIAGFFVVLRFQLSRLGNVLLAVIVGGFAVLDGYWLWLILRWLYG